MRPLYGLYMAFIRPIHGLYTAYIRHQYVEYTAYIWPTYGHDLRPLPSHGLYTAYIQPIYGLYAAYIWPLYGLYTAYIRPIYGKYPGQPCLNSRINTLLKMLVVIDRRWYYINIIFQKSKDNNIKSGKKSFHQSGKFLAINFLQSSALVVIRCLFFHMNSARLRAKASGSLIGRMKAVNRPYIGRI